MTSMKTGFGGTAASPQPEEKKMKNAPRLAAQQGLTLVELAIALAIAGIIAVLAVPSIRAVMPRMNLNSDTVTLTNTFALARATAISKSTQVNITFSEPNNSYTWGTDFSNTISPNVDLYAVDELGPDNTLVVEPVGTVGRMNGGTREDFPLGTVARLYLQTSDGMFKKRVSIDSMGRIKVEHQTPSVATWTEE